MFIIVLIILFSVSLFALVLMLTLRSRELSTGVGSTLARLFPENDEHIERNARIRARKVHIGANYLFKLFLEKLVSISKRIFFIFVYYTFKKAKDVKNMVKGKGILKKRGAVSFYLKDIAENKNNVVKKGKIHD